MSSAHAWPVILHHYIEKSELGRLLKQKAFKIRVSENVSPSSVIFPRSGVAFFILHVRDCLGGPASAEIKPEVLDSITKFVQVHRRCYLLLQATRHTDREKKLYFVLQQRYLQSSLQMIPVHSPAECLQAMLTIAKLLCKPTNELVTKRFEGVLSQAMAEDSTPAALEQLGVKTPQIQYIQDGIGGLAQLASASKDDLLNCSLDTEIVDKVTSVFK